MTKTNLLPRILRTKWILLLIPVIWGLLHLLLRPKPNAAPQLIAHRGASGLAPENTLAAIHAGFTYGAPMVEVDVQRSADGRLLLMHDLTVDRTTNGHGAVADLTWAEIQALDAGSHFSFRFAGEPAPSLEAALELAQADGVTLMIEVKDPERYPGLATNLIETIDRLAAPAQVLVISFDHDWIVEFQRQAPHIPVGFLAYWAGSVPRVPAGQVVSVFWGSVLLDPTLAPRLHEAGYEVIVFTVNHPQLMRWLLWLGVDGIVTDYPDRWSQVVNQA